jgi:hypothetical protein
LLLDNSRRAEKLNLMTRVVGAALVLTGLLAAQERTMGLLYHDSTRSYQGYTLFAPTVYHDVYLIDNQGRLVHSWYAPPKPDYGVYLLENGSLLRTALPSASRGEVEILDWDSNVTWSFDPDTIYPHHDVEMLPGGNVVMIAYEDWTRQEAIEAGRKPYLVPNGLRTEYLIEVDTATGEIVWEWHSWDHLVQDYDSTRRNFGIVRDHPELIDINFFQFVIRDMVHMNSVDYNAEFDQLMVSSREYQEVWVIDHGTSTEEARGHTGGKYGQGGDLLYRWGNPATYRRCDTTYHRLLYQHDPDWIPDSLEGAGRMLVFSNGADGLREWSSVDEWEPPVDSLGFYSLGPDSVFGPDTITWWYRETLGFYSVRISGSQRLPNGNTLICEGMSGEMFEVTPDSEVVWYYISPVDRNGPMTQGETIPHWANTVFRCYRYSPDFAGFAGHNLEPGDPIELPPLGISAGRDQGPAVSLAVEPSVPVREARLCVELGEAQWARLAVYDATGCRAALVVDRRLDRGRHRFKLSIGALAAGSYFCRLTTESGTRTQRIVVAR